ncbi:hypothetical protein M8H41_13705 [Desulfosporosinus nitroreducens]|uniref:Rod shape-determining protein MreD n=1 Tax=Desulfosporosinus nitroreducens TaxID=2018668 RepID=A0ABT8QRB7_9FIRM|nr:hypothetical protein [Desulfosporosinus nitroreducens]
MIVYLPWKAIWHPLFTLIFSFFIYDVKNSYLYSILYLSLVMILEGFNIEVPTMLSPIVTMMIIAFFLLKSVAHAKKLAA